MLNKSIKLYLLISVLYLPWISSYLAKLSWSNCSPGLSVFSPWCWKHGQNKRKLFRSPLLCNVLLTAWTIFCRVQRTTWAGNKPITAYRDSEPRASERHTLNLRPKPGKERSLSLSPGPKKHATILKLMSKKHTLL